ncbi:MAG TPA: CNNM domain-containing protein [Pirellulaceae bacterium]|nr:CNNM domain-containing protein [Pirellulaceae bacterium]
MTLLFTYVAIALVVSFLCSLLEASLLTITPSSIQAAKGRKVSWAPKLERLKSDIDRPLAAILTLNTIAHTMGAAGAGAQYARVFGNGTEALFAAALTFAVLVFTEIIPKTIGARYALTLAPFTTSVLPVMIAGLKPLVWFSKQLTKLITFGKAHEPPRHREELMAVAHLGRQSGQLHDRETQFLHNMLQLHRVKTSDIMTPRPVVFSLPLDIGSDAFVREIDDKPFTRIPLYDPDTGDTRGFVIKGEVLMEHVKRGSDGLALRDLLRPIDSVHGALTVDRLFQRFVSGHHQIMLVVDEYGTTAGLVTLEDVLETIFGFEIVDELDKVPDLQAYARELWVERASRLGIALAPSSPLHP